MQSKVVEPAPYTTSNEKVLRAYFSGMPISRDMPFSHGAAPRSTVCGARRIYFLTRHIYHFTRRICLLLSAVLVAIVASAQDVPPTSIRHGSRPVPDSLLEMVNTTRPAFIRGFNWGMATRRVNEELHSNFWHVFNPFAWSGTTYKPSAWTDPALTLSQVVADMRLVVAPGHAYDDAWLARNLPWYKALNDGAVARGHDPMVLHFGGTDPLALTEGLGFRFQPEYNVDTSVFTPHPRDTQGAVFGFRTRRLQAPAHATTDNKTPSAPYIMYTDQSRYYLSADSVKTNAEVNVDAQTHVADRANRVVVLEGSWPSNRFVLWNEHAQNEQTAPFNGKRMYLAVNMRRTNELDTVLDDAVVLRIRIDRNDCGNEAPTQTGRGTGGRAYAQALDSVANPDGTRVVLPKLLDTITNGGFRGQISTLVPATSADELVITRRMLPRGDNRHPDVTLLAHYTINNLREQWRTGTPCMSGDSGRLENMHVRVVYEGRSDVAIDWVQLGTENMTWLTQGWYDRFADTTYRQILSHLRQYNRQHAGRVVRTSDNVGADLGLRVYKWFNRDEGGEQYWEGMRYVHMLFDSNTTTERGFDNHAARYNHIALSDLTWQGTMPFPDVNTIAPYYQHGYNASKTDRRLFLDHEWGMQNLDMGNRVDYDVRWGRHKNGSVALPADTLGAFYPGANAFASGSLQQRYEWQRYNLMLQPHFLFDAQRPWIANPWVFSQWETTDTTVIPAPIIWRFPTGEEVRLELYSALILGAKGYALFWGANKHNARRPADYLASVGGASMGFAYAPSADLLDVGLRSDSAGPDYLTPDNRTGLYQALNQQHPFTVANIARTLGVAEDKLYVGFRSMRLAIAEVFDKTRRAEDTLARLQLVTWFSKGFRTWSLGDTSALTRIIAPSARSIQTRHPYRRDFEPYDSTFVELSLLRDTTRVFAHANVDFRSDTTPDRGEAFVLGVLNRRCNPFYYSDRDVRTFVSLAAHDDAVRQAVKNWARENPSVAKNGRYAQQGAREIIIRFNYRHPDGRPRTLHIKSLGEESDAAVGYAPPDERIAQDGSLRVMCMPGEGKMLWVEVEEYKP